MVCVCARLSVYLFGTQVYMCVWVYTPIHVCDLASFQCPVSYTVLCLIFLRHDLSVDQICVNYLASEPEMCLSLPVSTRLTSTSP